MHLHLVKQNSLILNLQDGKPIKKKVKNIKEKYYY
jgi:hypothetical protein